MCAMLIDGGGGGGRRMVPESSAPTSQPVAHHAAHSGSSDTGVELRRRLAALAEQLREAQRQAEAARQQAAQAQLQAQQAHVQAQAAREKAHRTHQPKDVNAANLAEQEAKEKEAQLNKKSTAADLRDKDVTLLQAKQSQVRAQMSHPAHKASPEANQQVQVAQVDYDEAKRLDTVAGRFADWQEAETCAQKAEFAQAQPGQGAMMRPGANPAELRAQANAARAKFQSAVGDEAQIELFGPSPGPAVAPPVIGPSIRTPLDQFLQVSPFRAQAGGGSPVSAMLGGIAEGKSLGQVANEHRKSVDQVVAEAAQVGIQIHANEADGGEVQNITLTQGNTQVTYSHDRQHDTVSVEGTFTDTKGKRQELQAAQDGNGVIRRTVHDRDQRQTVTDSIDTHAGTRTTIVVSASGQRTETTTDLGRTTVMRKVKAGDSIQGIAREHGLSPKQLQALNPDLTNAQDFYAGRELVVSSPRTTVKVFYGDGSMLHTTTGANGSKRVVFEAASGRRTTLLGSQDAQERTQRAVRDGLFKEGKTVAQVGDKLGMTQAQVLACLDRDTVDVQPASSDNGDLEIRKLYDRVSNTLVIETHDYQHGTVRREIIEDKHDRQVFHVRQFDSKSGKYVTVPMSGGTGYVQQEADRQLHKVNDLDRQIREVNVAIRMASRMGEPIAELRARRENLVTQRDAAKQDADVQQGKATLVLMSNQKYKWETVAASASDRVSTTLPGSAAHALAEERLDEVIGQLDHLDRGIDFAAADLTLLKATRDLHHAEATQRQATQQQETQYQAWKINVWRPEQALNNQMMGLPPDYQQYRNAQDEDEAARKSFEQSQLTLEPTLGQAPTGGKVPWRDAWLASTQAADASLKSKLAFEDASIAQQDAELKMTQGDVARLQERKSAWLTANPDAFSETFGKQAELDNAQARVVALSVGGLQAVEARKHDQYLLSLPFEQRHYMPERQQAELRYQDDNRLAHAELAVRIDQIQRSVIDAKIVAADGFILAHPDLMAQRGRLEVTPGTSPRVAEHLGEQHRQLMGPTKEFRNLQAALDVKAQAGLQLSTRLDGDLVRVSQDLEEMEKGRDGHSWVREGWSALFGDASDDAKDYAQDLRGQIRTLSDNLAAGKISQSEFTRQENSLMAGYGVESARLAGKMEDNDQTWGVVDEVVRSTVIMAAGVATRTYSHLTGPYVPHSSTGKRLKAVRHPG